MMGAMQERARAAADRILDRRCPDLAGEERDRARERLFNLARVLVEIAGQQVQHMPRGDSRESPTGGKIPRLPEA